MGKQKFKKIPVSDFISDKKLSKIEEIISKSDDVETNYDRIEMLLDEDFEVKDLGTNRLVLLHKKKKYKDLIFKVAGDPHGIEANYREFYNGDLDKRLTFSFSISKNGVFIVQERVKPFTRDIMKKHKKETREMLKKLSKKLLLVDCKLDNFKNFGLRDDDEVCLLDHGDTVPLPNYQGDAIVNANEECYVSLRCKKPVDIGADKKHMRACGGKLKYSKNFDYLVCEDCGGVCTVNEAYREFYGDKDVKVKGGIEYEVLDSFDPDEWKAQIKQYCIETMSLTDNNNFKGENIMKTKTINGTNCIQIKGFWLPEPNENTSLLFTAVKMGESKPHKYLEKLGLDPEEYKVHPSDHTPSERPKHKKKPEKVQEELGFDVVSVARQIVDEAEKTGLYESLVTYVKCAQILPDVDFSNMNNIKAIREFVSKDKRTSGCIYNENGFSVRVINGKKENSEPEVNEEFVIHKKEIIENDIEEDSIDNIDEPDVSSDIEYNSEEAENIYASRNGSKVVTDEFDTDDEVSRKSISLTSEDITNNTIDYNGVECVVVNKYAVPLNIIYRYLSEETGCYELPTTKMKQLLKMNGLHAKKYKLQTSEDDEIIEGQDSNEELNGIGEIDVSQPVFDPGSDNSDDNIEFEKMLYELTERYAEEHPESIDTRFGYVNIPAAEIVMNCFVSKSETHKVPAIDDIAIVENINEKNVSVTMTYETMDHLYNLIRRSINQTSDIGCDYQKMEISVYMDKYKAEPKSDEEIYSEIANNPENIEREFDTHEIPLSMVDADICFNCDLNDEIAAEHEIFNDHISVLSDAFSLFYTNYDDNAIREIAWEGEALDTITEYFRIKAELFANKTLYMFIQNICAHPEYFETLTDMVILISEHAYAYFEDIDEDLEEYADTLNSGENWESFWNIAKKLKITESDEIESDSASDINESMADSNTSTITTENAEYASENREDQIESEQNSEEINSYNPNNNTNNNEESGEKEEDELTKEAIQAIRDLIEVVKENNQLIKSENESIHKRFNDIEPVIGDIKNAVIKQKDPVRLGNNDTEDNSNDMIDCKIEHMDNGRIVTYNADDIKDCTFAINIGDKTVCFSLEELASRAIANSDAKFVQVSDIEVTEL